MFRHIEHNISRPFVKEEHTDDGHFYRTENGQLYPSITTVFKQVIPKPWYNMWIQKLAREHNTDWEGAEKIAKNIGKESTDVGTAMHKLAEDYVNNKELTKYDPEEFATDPYKLFEPLSQHLDEYVDNIYGTEAKVYSDFLEVAGTSDLVAEYDGVLSIIDYKNSRKPKSESKIRDQKYYEQICAYGKMWEFCTNEKVEQGVILVASWNGNVRPFKVKLKDHELGLYDLLLKYEAIS